MKDEIRFLKEVIKAQDKMLSCYRFGGQPPEWVFDKLSKARKTYGDLQKMNTSNDTHPIRIRK